MEPGPPGLAPGDGEALGHQARRGSEVPPGNKFWQAFVVLAKLPGVRRPARKRSLGAPP
jgi:hypothetical protein